MSPTIPTPPSRRLSPAFGVFLVLSAVAHAADWVRAGVNVRQPRWGLAGGLQFAVPPGGFDGGDGGPRGLIRLGSPVLTNAAYDLVNFIAIEPVVNGHKGFSELEPSRIDGVRGKLIRAVDPAAGGDPTTNLVAGTLSSPAPGIERLEVTLAIERFDNGAHVRVVVSQRGDAPDEIELAVHADPDGAAMDYCILTATMGNKARVRRLWLADAVVDSRNLYPAYRENGFAAHTFYPTERLRHTAAGDVWVAATTDEEDPAASMPFPGSRAWYYAGTKVTQYWKKPADDLRPDLHVAVNARFAYWQSSQPIPGGIAFENFELRERFHDGQRFVFGITRKSPAELHRDRPARPGP